MLEKIQRRATKYILSDYVSDYKCRLTSLGILPLMMFFELQEVVLFVKSLKYPSTSFNVLDYVSESGKLNHIGSRTKFSGHFYFRRLPRLWNALPIINLNSSVNVITACLKKFFWNHFLTHFNSSDTCSFHFQCPCYKCSNSPVLSNYYSSFL